MTSPLIIEIAIAPRAAIDTGRLLQALHHLTRDAASLAFSHDPESGQTILKGGSEQALDDAIATLEEEIGVAIGAPQVAYRETLTRRIEIDETFKRQTGDAGQFAKVKIVVEPTARGAGTSFETLVVGGAVPAAFLPGVESGISVVMGSGILAGFPVVDVKVTLVDGAFHATDSSPRAFEIVSTSAFRRALKEGGSLLLEPVMVIEITMPEAYRDLVIGDLHARRGRVEKMESRADTLVIKGLVPLANTFGYANQLRSGTQSRGSHAIRFSHYAPVLPPENDGPAAPAIALRR